jgi:hypothetical protein
MTLHNSVAEQLTHFRFGHLPDHLQRISAPYCLLAVHLVRTTPNGPGVTRTLGHLRRAKDEAVTAAIVGGKTADELQAVALKVIGEADEWLAKNGLPFVIADAVS